MAVPYGRTGGIYLWTHCHALVSSLVDLQWHSRRSAVTQPRDMPMRCVNIHISRQCLCPLGSCTKMAAGMRRVSSKSSAWRHHYPEAVWFLVPHSSSALRQPAGCMITGSPARVRVVPCQNSSRHCMMTSSPARVCDMHQNSTHNPGARHRKRTWAVKVQRKSKHFLS